MTTKARRDSQILNAFVQARTGLVNLRRTLSKPSQETETGSKIIALVVEQENDLSKLQQYAERHFGI